MGRDFCSKMYDSDDQDAPYECYKEAVGFHLALFWDEIISESQEVELGFCEEHEKALYDIVLYDGIYSYISTEYF